MGSMGLESPAPPTALALVVPPKFPSAGSARGSVLWGRRCSPREMVYNGGFLQWGVPGYLKNGWFTMENPNWVKILRGDQFFGSFWGITADKSRPLPVLATRAQTNTLYCRGSTRYDLQTNIWWFPKMGVLPVIIHL